MSKGKRGRRVILTLKDSEYEVIAKAAEERGLPISAFFRTEALRAAKEIEGKK